MNHLIECWGLWQADAERMTGLPEAHDGCGQSWRLLLREVSEAAAA